MRTVLMMIVAWKCPSMSLMNKIKNYYKRKYDEKARSFVQCGGDKHFPGFAF